MSNKIIVMGLGAGDLDQLPYGIYKQLKTCGKIYTRTMDHPVIDELQQEGVQFESFDAVYEKYDTFEEVYEEISDTIIRLAESSDVVYTVPGHPMVAEMTVQLLIEKTAKQQIELSIEGGQSFLDALFQAVKIDPIDGFQLLDGTALNRDSLQMKQHIIIGQVYDGYIASEVKLTLMEKYPDDYQVALVTAAGSSAEEVIWLPLYELDRQAKLSNLTSVYVPPVTNEELLQKEFFKLRNIIAELRGPNGCPWDQKQTHESLKKYVLEEAYELIDAIDEDDTDGIISELGDVLLQVLLHAQIGEDEGMFTIDDVVQELSEKMIRRHPHVFGDTHVENEDEVLVNWNKIKLEEKGEAALQTESLLADVEKSLPQLLIAYEYQKRAAKVGFDWDEVESAWEKVNEEIQEFQAEIKKGSSKAEIRAEYGDVLFALVNIARFHNIYPEEALHATNMKFARRFQYIEKCLQEQGLTFDQCKLEQLDRYWDEAKSKGM
ncbi:nucleoside triphosphate pyrophosphohydrolase [Bacillus massiliigorillae]|uniref:nucleoside triphosphate pyrophosphohydrolase n=1 Tax=Bacillus massiliigorillae TaxID=1243664 RepID=UPI00039AE66F|nr:nucleoside triphosphate pyrophosphohydrolase [Bacillus massiliigorillae]